MSNLLVLLQEFCLALVALVKVVSVFKGLQGQQAIGHGVVDLDRWGSPVSRARLALPLKGKGVKRVPFPGN